MNNHALNREIALWMGEMKYGYGSSYVFPSIEEARENLGRDHPGVPVYDPYEYFPSYTDSHRDAMRLFEAMNDPDRPSHKVQYIIRFGEGKYWVIRDTPYHSSYARSWSSEELSITITSAFKTDFLGVYDNE